MRRAGSGIAWVLAAIAAGCATGPEQTAERQRASQPETLTSYGIAADGGTEGQEVWFKLAKTDQRFVFDKERTPDVAAITDILDASSSSGRSLRVTFDLASATFDTGQDKPSYVVREIEYEGRTVAGMVGARRSTMAPSRAEAALARGIALYNGTHFAPAIAELDAALGGDALKADRRALALATRGQARVDAISATGNEVTTKRDRTLVAALEDFRAWGALAAGDNEPLFKQAEALRDLGAYDEALVIYEAMPTDDPNDAYWNALRIGATYRTKGEFDKALAAIDALAKTGVVPEGMAWHYHRGWTLHKMGRHDEAIREFTTGLETQPDFSGAFIYRACANLRVGRLAAALDDRRQAQAIMAFTWKDQEMPWLAKDEVEVGERMIAALEGAIARGSTGPLDVPCVSETDYGDRKRERSRLLPD